MRCSGMRGKFVAYYRVSTEGQGRSGLGLAAQQAAVANSCSAFGGPLPLACGDDGSAPDPASE